MRKAPVKNYSARMRASLVNLAVFVSSFALLGAAQSSDVCGEVSAVLKLPSLAPPHKVITHGTICGYIIFIQIVPLTLTIYSAECICISHISNYVGSTSLTVSAVASAGRSAVINAITQMVFLSVVS